MIHLKSCLFYLISFFALSIRWLIGLKSQLWSFFYNNPEQITPTKTIWKLSPGRNKLLYNTKQGMVLMDLFTDQRQTFPWGGMDWLDENLLVFNDFILDIRDNSRIPSKSVYPRELDLEQVQQTADKVYIWLWLYENNENLIDKYRDRIVILTNDYRNKSEGNYQVYLPTYKEDEEPYQQLKELFLKPGHYIEAPGQRELHYMDKKVYSPNGAYYYVNDGGILAIYDARTDAKLVSTVARGIFAGLLTPNYTFYVEGWDAGSRAVYFHKSYGGGLAVIDSSGSTPVYRLKVP